MEDRGEMARDIKDNFEISLMVSIGQIPLETMLLHNTY